MSDFERAQEAHRAVFAMVTAAITSPYEADLETMIADRAHDAENPARALADITHAAIWHAAGALLAHAGGDTETALALVKEGALMQEMKEPPQ